jgi:phosphoribosylamine--glycine ligase
MKTLLLGGGGREHALYWKLKQSARITTLHAWPGNGGFPLESIPPALAAAGSLDPNDPASVRAFVERHGYEFVIVGPEQPLVNGVVDALAGVCPVFGPSAYCAQLEGSKDFAKQFMRSVGVPTAAAEAFTDSGAALAYLRSLPDGPVVIKADGLAAGKGVVVARDRAEAEEAVRASLERRVFGSASSKVLIEEFMAGEEASVFALCDGERAIPFVACQDHKRAYDGDQGPNTGGMGAYCPAPVATPAVMEQVQREVLDPVVAGMKAAGHPYRGLLYAGLMIENDRARVVEFNVRFGDPETQALLRLLDEDLGELMWTAAAGSFSPDRRLRFRSGAAIVVVLAAEGYPDAYRKNIPLKGIDSQEGDIIIFHAGSRREGTEILSSGGRVLGVTAAAESFTAARELAYAGLKNISAPGLFFRKDIGEKALKWI